MQIPRLKKHTGMAARAQYRRAVQSGKAKALPKKRLLEIAMRLQAPHVDKK